ncbi:Uncharacterised protein [Bordetella pertussis]|nr:Uncharacterised protein [Bordetella pertussis]
MTRKSCDSCASSPGTALTGPMARARNCSIAACSIHSAMTADSSIELPAVNRPWLASRMARFSPSAAEITSPSLSPMGRPGHCGR